MNYFERYKNYYDSLKGNESIINKAKELSDFCSNKLDQTNSYITKIVESNWQESGADLVKNNIFSNLKSLYAQLNNFVSENLVGVCDLAINQLLPILENIKNKEVEFQNKETELSIKISERDSISIPNNVDDATFAKIKSKIAGINSIISDLRNEMAGITNTLEQLCNDANKTIENILRLDNMNEIKLKNIVSRLNGLNNGIFEVSSIKNGYKDEVGPYYIVNLSNDKKFKLYDQYYWGGINIRMPNGEERNMGGGCSLFAMASVLQYLTQNLDITAKCISKASSGNFDGFSAMLNGKDIITVNDKKYTVKSDISSKRSYGEDSSKEEVIEDWKNTLENGGTIYLNVTRKIKGYIDYRGNIITSDFLRGTTGIASEGGHVIAMMGLNPNGEIIFADSMLAADGSKDKYEFGVNKHLTLEEFYDFYGGNSNTYETSKYYYTVSSAELVPIESASR